MSTTSLTSPPELPYLLLRAARALFEKPPAELDEAQLAAARAQARREYAIEARVLGSAEAAGVIVPEQEVERAWGEIRQRYEDEDGFLADLQRNGLDGERMRLALYRQCRIDSVLEKVAAAAPEPTEVDIGIYYHAHLDKLRQPELREAFHILVSINDQFPENTRDQAWTRIQSLAEQLQRKPHRFGSLAQRHSECPSALQEGRIGMVRRGQLFPELDEILFRQKEGDIGGPVETEVGFHLVKCGKIQPPHHLSLREATPNIRQRLHERLREQHQRSWIAALLGTEPQERT